MRARGSTILVLLAALILGAGCPKKSSDELGKDVIALVNGAQVSKVAFERELRRELRTADESSIQTPAQLEPFKQSVLTTMIERALLMQAAREVNLKVSPEEVERRVLRIRADYPPDGFEAALNEGHLSLSELKEQTEVLLTIEKLYEEHVYPRVAVTEDEMQAYFESHPEASVEPEQVRAAQIVVKGLDDARRIQAQLKGGKKFGDLARRYSLSADAKVGGDLGFFAKGEMPPDFDNAVFALSPGQVSDVVFTDYGYHLFKLLERRPARKKTLAEVRTQLEQSLLKDKRIEAQNRYLEGLRTKAAIKVNDELLAAVRTQ